MVFQIKKLKIINKDRKYKNVPLFDKSIKLNSKGVYFLFDKNLKLLYIGRTKCFRKRLLQHVSPYHYSREMWEGISYKKMSGYPLGKIRYYSFISIKDEQKRNITELILINIFKPKYNHIKRN